MPIVFQDVTLRSEQEGDTAGQLFTCGQCAGETFIVFRIMSGIEAGHLHIQCRTCDMAYCQAGAERRN